MRWKAHLFHGRNGYRTGPDDVGKDTAAEAAEESTADHGHFGRAAAGMPRYGHRQVEEEFSCAGPDE